MKYRIARDGKEFVVQIRMFGFMWITLLNRQKFGWSKAKFADLSEAETAMYENAKQHNARKSFRVVREYAL